MSARQEDVNGYIEIEGNPISKVGVFPYLGGQIDDALERNKIYYVYRPEDELVTQECIDSFKLLPFTDEHAMLGSSKDGLTPPEEKGVHGVTGENVYFEYPYLKSNVKIFSEHLNEEIGNGKVELSIGYRCEYEPQQGSFDGKSYDFIQRKIRGNHLALVEEGRSGKDVKVLDHFKFTFDSGALKMEEEIKDMPNGDAAGEMSLEEKVENCAKAIENLTGMMSRMLKAEKSEASEQSDEVPVNPYAKDEDTKEPDGETKAADNFEDEDDDMSEDKKMEDKKMEDKKMSDSKVADKKSMDARPALDINDIKRNLFVEIENRNKLYTKVSDLVGVFTHDSMTLEDVAQYGIKKLGIKCKKGHEEAAIEGYLMGLKKASFNNGISMDASFTKCDAIEEYVNKGVN
jgi:uncharacterized protein